MCPSTPGPEHDEKTNKRVWQKTFHRRTRKHKNKQCQSGGQGMSQKIQNIMKKEGEESRQEEGIKF